MESLCLLFNVRPDWPSAKTLLGDPGLMKKMIDYDKVYIMHSGIVLYSPIRTEVVV